MARLTLNECTLLCEKALAAHGLHAEAIASIAANITAAERDGSKSHGLFRLPGFCASMSSGRVCRDARPQVRSPAPAAVVVDACGGFSTPAVIAGLPLLTEKAKEQGVATLVIERAHHFGALWPDVEPLAAKHGLVALAFLNSKAFIAHTPGGTTPLYGTNPFAFACPRANPSGEGLSDCPVVFDMASAAMARGDIQLAARDGYELPEGCGLDEFGKPTRDAAAALRGAQLPFGGHKGTSIALMVELLAAAITGDQFAFEALANDNGDGGPTQHGQLIIALDPSRCGGQSRARFLARVEALMGRISEEAEGCPSVRLPSERRFTNRLRTPTEGIEIPQALYDQCLKLGGESTGSAL
eukprot:TRINITY_DN76324_c0_g1_i1.p1 TRINITY_DN76324_c0_g1~~TRINITY_DN76324_c0_g1_i1.p1  ORF type:complete len:379 (-),score=52.21 TRINITY_DN76324_c0_g1_i1:202-1269(-)